MNQGAWQEPPEPRGGGSGFGSGMPQLSMPSLTPVTKKLLIANFAIWIFTWLLSMTVPGFGRGLLEFFALSPDAWRRWFPVVPVWELVTYGFMHSVDDPMHILFNSLMLYFFGTMLEGIVGSRRFLTTYLVAMVVGGLGQVIWGLAYGHAEITVGASGAVLGALVACAVLQPKTPVIFIIVFTPLWVLASILVGIDLFFFVSGGGRTAYLVHLLGAAYGFVAARRGWIYKDPLEIWERRRAVKQEDRQRSDEERLDSLLERIHKEGIHSLSAREREFLKRVSKRR